MSILANQIEMLREAASLEVRGTVTEVRGLALNVIDLPVPIGAMVRIISKRDGRAAIEGEVVGFDNMQTVVMPLGRTGGIGRGDHVIAMQHAQLVRCGDSLLGRILDGRGEPIDGGGPMTDTLCRPLYPQPVDPLDRPLIDQPLAVGIRAVDAMCTLGRGQRIGVFAAPGLGKSTLLGLIARHTDADVSVIALVGERGREVRDFIETQLGEEGLKRSVVVVATGDEPALLRIRAALVATTIAEYFRDAGRDVLLMMDSITRFCQAQRQVGLAAGEPPATKGYPPSVFAMLPSLLERSGRTSLGSITGLYAVLVEGEEEMDPISDAARGVLDGHIGLSRDLANKGHWPAIDVLSSISRVAKDVTDEQQQEARSRLVRLEHDYRRVEDLLNIGAYAAGSNPDFDLAIAAKPILDKFLQQGLNEVKGRAEFGRTRGELIAMVQNIEQTAKQLSSMRQRPPQGPGDR